MGKQLDELREIEKWMRERGVARVKLKDGTELELGPLPAPPSNEKKPTEAELVRRELVRRNRVLFAATSTKPRIPNGS